MIHGSTMFCIYRQLIYFTVATSFHANIVIDQRFNELTQIHYFFAGSMLGQRRRRWSNIEPAKYERLVFAARILCTVVSTPCPSRLLRFHPARHVGLLLV